MRSFIAIELPPEIKNSLADLQNQLKAQQADVKWVEPCNIHLTLKFLGEIDDKKIKEVTQILEDTTKDKNTFYIRISSMGAFPKINFPRVIWVGIDKGEEEVKQIAKSLEQNLAKIGLPLEDRPFSSHITIGRIRSGLNRERLVKGLNALETNFGKEFAEFRVTRIILFKSTLTPQGPVYEILNAANLKTN